MPLERLIGIWTPLSRTNRKIGPAVKKHRSVRIAVFMAVVAVIVSMFLTQPASATPAAAAAPAVQMQATPAQVMPTAIWSDHTMRLYQAQGYQTLLEVWDLNWDCDYIGYGHTVSTFWWWDDGNTASSFRVFGSWLHCNYAGIRNQDGITKWKCISWRDPGWSLFPLDGWNDNIEWWGVKYNYRCPLY